MRPLLFPVGLAAFLCALLLPMAAAAKVADHASPPAVTITASPMAVVHGGSTVISGTVFMNVHQERRLTVTHEAPGPDVWLGFYRGSNCSSDDYVSGQVAPVTWAQTKSWDRKHHEFHFAFTGNGTFGPITSDPLAPGNYSFRAGFGNETACVAVTVTEVREPVLTITADPSTFAAGGKTDVSGTTKHDTEAVFVGMYTDYGCNAADFADPQPAGVGVVAAHNHTWDAGLIGPLATGHYSFRVAEDNDTACVDVNVTAATTEPEQKPAPLVHLAGENSFFLCYSVFQVEPGVWPAHIAGELLAGGGYWQPYAVKGNVPYGTNVGDYHLVCNIATGQAAGQQFSGTGGDISGTEAFPMLTGQLGWYPLVP
jgi:hypothetical protein